MYKSIKVTFDEVKLKAKKTWKDETTGKRRQVTKTFFQTVNPFNKNANGKAKTKREIYEELIADRNAWLASGARE